MKTKRFWATLLSVVVIVSSQGFGSNAYAMPGETDVSVVAADETDAAVTDFEAADAVISDAAVTDIGSSEVIIEEPDADTADSEAAADDKAADEIIIEDGDEEFYVSSDSLEPLGTASSFFEVDATGTLRVKDGMTASGTVIVPADAVIIPKGILNTPAVTGISFETGSLLTTIEAGAFEDSRITSIIIPKGVEEIKDSTFKNVTTLATVSFEQGNRLVSVGKEAFLNTPIVTFNATYVEQVGASAFSGCKSLKNLDLPRLVGVGDYAFNGCTALGTIAFSRDLSSVGQLAFSTTAMNVVDLSDCDGLTLGEGAFSFNNALSTVILPGGLEDIPKRAFYSCTKLTELTIAEGTETIGESAFEGCTSLTEVRTPSTTYRISTKAFAGCLALKTIFINYPSPDDEEFFIASTAFPLGKKNSKGEKTDTIKGYDGKVQEFANAHNYKFTTLVTRHKIQIATSDEQKKQVTITASADKDVPSGKMISVTVTPKDDNVLKDIKIECDKKTPITLKDCGSTQQVFEFRMPAEDVIIRATMAKKDTVDSDPKSYSVSAINGYVPAVDDITGITFDMTGRSTQLTIKDKNGNPVNTWFYKFESSNSAVTVNSTGILRAVSKGSSTITVTSRLSTSKKLNIPVTVTREAPISSIELVLPEVSKSARFDVETYHGEEEDSEIPLVIYNKAALATGNRTLELSINAFTEGEQRSLRVSSEWKSSNTSVATVKNTTSTTNANTITIKQGSFGESTITVTTNGADGKVTEDTTARFIIRVMDVTPRIDKTTYTVDSTTTLGTKLTITEVYGYKIFNNQLSLKVGKRDGVLCPDLEVAYIDGNYYLRNKTGSPFAKEYKDDKKLYITGVFEDAEDEDFAIELTKVSVTEGGFNPTITLKNKINLFYKMSDNGGSVKLTQDKKNTQVKEIRLVSNENYKKNEPHAVDDPFSANFTVTPVDNANYTITRTNTALEKDKDGKEILSGYVYLVYDGYEDPIWKKITIPTYNTAPELVLDTSSAVASKQASGQVYPVHIVDKKTKKKVMSLANLDTEVAPGGAINGLGLTESAKTVFEALDINEARTTDTINLKLNDNLPAKKYEAKFYVQDATWSTKLEFTFTVTVKSELPTVTLKSKTVTLNNALPGHSAILATKIDRKDAHISDWGEVTFTGKSKLQDAAQELIDAMDPADEGGLQIGLPADIPTGSYTFKVKPVISYDNNADTRDGNELKFTVKVVKTTPKLSLKSKTFKLNMNYPGVETVETKYSFTGLPTGVTANLDVSSAQMTQTKSTYPDFEDIAEMEVEEDKLQIKLKEEADAYPGKKFSYYATGLEVHGDGEPVVLPRITITLNLIDAVPTVKVKASGKLNPIDASTSIKYTATLSNFTGTITGVDVVEWDKEHNVEFEDDSDAHFDVELDPENPKKAILTLSDENRDTLKNGKSYKLSLYYKINEDVEAKTIVNVTPKQSYPTLVVKSNRNTIYGAEADDDRYIRISVLQKAPEKGKTAMDCNMTGVEFSKDTSAKVKKAFQIVEYDEENHEVVLWLANYSDLGVDKPEGKEYTLKFVPTYEGQAGDSTAAAFNVKITVKP